MLRTNIIHQLPRTKFKVGRVNTYLIYGFTIFGYGNLISQTGILVTSGPILDFNRKI